MFTCDVSTKIEIVLYDTDGNVVERKRMSEKTTQNPEDFKKTKKEIDDQVKRMTDTFGDWFKDN